MVLTENEAPFFESVQTKVAMTATGLEHTATYFVASVTYMIVLLCGLFFPNPL